MISELRDSGTRGRYSNLPPMTYSEMNYAHYTPINSDYLTRFYSALKRWRFETLTESSTDKIVSHPSFRDIVAIGSKIVPNIIDELRVRPDFLVAALTLILDENPVPETCIGDLEAMANSWISWHESHQ